MQTESMESNLSILSTRHPQYILFINIFLTIKGLFGKFNVREIMKYTTFNISE